MSAVRIRAARAADLAGVVAVFVSCWRRGYVGILPDTVIEQWDEASARTVWGGFLRGAHEQVAVADARGEVVGLVRFRPDPDAPAYGYVASLYVHPDRGSGGIGRMLLEHAETSLARAGHRAARLWVFASNAPAIRFYERCGWHKDGRTRLEPRYEVPEIGMTRALRPRCGVRSDVAGGQPRSRR